MLAPESRQVDKHVPAFKLLIALQTIQNHQSRCWFPPHPPLSLPLPLRLVPTMNTRMLSLVPPTAVYTPELGHRGCGSPHSVTSPRLHYALLCDEPAVAVLRKHRNAVLHAQKVVEERGEAKDQPRGQEMKNTIKRQTTKVCMVRVHAAKQD